MAKHKVKVTKTEYKIQGTIFINYLSVHLWIEPRFTGFEHERIIIYKCEQNKPLRWRSLKQNADFQEGISELRVLPHLC